MTMNSYARINLLTLALIFLLGTVFARILTENIFHAGNIYDLKRFSLIYVAFSSILLLCFVKDAKIIKISTETKLALWAFFGFAIISSIINKHPYWSLIDVANYGLVAILLFNVASSMRLVDKDSLVYGIYVFIALFCALIFSKYLVFLLHHLITAKPFTIHALVRDFSNVRHFNQVQVMIIPLLYLPFFNARVEQFKRLSVLLMALHWMALLQSEARGAMLSLIAVFAMMFFFIPSDRRQAFFKAKLLSVGLGVILWFLLIIVLPYWLIEYNNLRLRTSSSGRIDIWLYVLKSIPENLWFGFGPMSYTWAEGKPSLYTHPHNLVMHFLFEFGLIFTIVSMLWLSKKTISLFINLREIKVHANIAVTYAILTALCYSLFDSLIVQPMALLTLTLLMAFYLALQQTVVNRLSINYKCAAVALASVLSLLMLSSYQHHDLAPKYFTRIWIKGIVEPKVDNALGANVK